jgi:hypothetical protein
VARRTIYRVAGEWLPVEARDDWAAHTIDAFFERWYLTPETGANAVSPAPAIVMSSDGRPAPIPPGLPHFAIAGGGTCYADGAASYIEIDGSVVTIGSRGPVEVSVPGPLALESPSLTRIVTYALAAALRKRRRFELHSAAVIDPGSGDGVLIIGASGSGKSTLAVNLASAGWPFLTDDVLLLSEESSRVAAWPLRRYFAVTPETVGSCRRLRSRTSRDRMDTDMDGKRHFLPHEIFATGFRDRCVPRTLLFPRLTGDGRTSVSRLSSSETMARLIRMNPWSCYDRSTAGEHLAVLSALAKQASGFSLLAGRDLLDPDAAAMLLAACVRGHAA